MTITYLCDIEDDARLLRELADSECKVLSTYAVRFIDGTSRLQYHVELWDGIRGHIVPASKAALQRQRNMPPRSWVYIGRVSKQV